MIETSEELQAAIIRYSPYLQEFRKRLLIVVSVFLVGATIGFIYFEPIIKGILGFYNLKGINIVFTSPFQFINLAINSAMVVGIIMVFPLILYQLLAFLKPALKKHEYQLLVSSIPLSILLFVVGFSFGIWIMKFVVALFSQQSTELQVQNLWDIQNFMANIFTTAVLLGVFFQFPIVITALIKLRVVEFTKIVGLRLPCYVGLLVLTIMLPPTDLLSNALIFFPLVLLFEITLLCNRSNNNVRRKK